MIWKISCNFWTVGAPIISKCYTMRNLKVAATIFSIVFCYSLLFAGWPNHIVISEIAFRGEGGAHDEFVELYNPTDSAVDISNWCLLKKPIEKNYSNLITIPSGKVIQPYSFFLITAHDAPPALLELADATWNTGGYGTTLTDSGATIKLTGPSPDYDLKDKVAYTGTENPGDDPEGTAAPKHEDGGSIERKATASSDDSSMGEGGSHEYLGNGEDSEDNSADFIVRNSRDPQSLSDETIEPVPPPPPTGISVIDEKNDGTLKLSWTPDRYSEGTYDHFEIYRGKSTSTISSYAVTSDSTTLVYWDGTHPLDDVEVNVTYYYQVSAVAEHPEVTNEGDKTSVVFAFATDKVAPNVPTGLSALDTGAGNEILLTWTPSTSDDVSFTKIGYKNSYFPTFDTFGVSTYTISARYDSSKSSWTVVTGLTDGVTYYFRISAIDKNENESTLSSTATAYSTDITPPEKVVINNIENEGSGTAINLYWTGYSPPSDIAGYKIWYDTVNFNFTNNADLWGIVSGKDIKSKTVTGLTEGETYYFAITAFDEVPNEETNVSGYTINAYPQNTPPQEITTLTAFNEGTGGKITLQWTSSSESDVTGYNIYQAKFSTLTKTDCEYSCFVSTPLTSRVMTGLTDFVTYFFRISAMDSGSQESVLSSTVSAVPSDITPPSPPSNIKIQEPPYSDYPEGGVLKLNWENPPDVDFSSVTIYRAVSTTTILDNPILLTSATFHTDTGLYNGVTYYYTIRSMDNYGNESQNTTYYYERPRDSVNPSSVTLIGFDMGNGSEVYLSWDISSETDFKCYVLERDSSIITAISTRNTSFYIDT
ncbi:MAG: lamin tail domain-containing protein, partial [Elusimicrobia bacterium]|nr:lamin tail domain-containing protein [Elusimicrobiota bacterium]